MSKFTKNLVLFFMMMTANISMAASISISITDSPIETIYVTTVADAETAPKESLREAIIKANASKADSVRILFLFDTNEDHQINVVTQLPAIKKSHVGIDKATSCKGKVIINGNYYDNIPSDDKIYFGLQLYADKISVEHICIQNFYYGISGNQLTNNTMNLTELLR